MKASDLKILTLTSHCARDTAHIRGIARTPEKPSKIESLATIVVATIIVAKLFILYACQGPNYISENDQSILWINSS